MLQCRNWIVTKTKLFEFSLFNGNHEIIDETLEQKIKASNFVITQRF